MLPDANHCLSRARSLAGGTALWLWPPLDWRLDSTHLIFICRDSYLISASFITVEATQAVSIVWMSRPQNFSVVSTCFAPNWTCVEVRLKRGSFGALALTFSSRWPHRLTRSEHRRTSGSTFYLIPSSRPAATRSCCWRAFKKPNSSTLHTSNTSRGRRSRTHRWSRMDAMRWAKKLKSLGGKPKMCNANGAKALPRRSLSSRIFLSFFLFLCLTFCLPLDVSSFLHFCRLTVNRGESLSCDFRWLQNFWTEKKNSKNSHSAAEPIAVYRWLSTSCYVSLVVVPHCLLGKIFCQQKNKNKKNPKFNVQKRATGRKNKTFSPPTSFHSKHTADGEQRTITNGSNQVMLHCSTVSFRAALLVCWHSPCDGFFTWLFFYHPSVPPDPSEQRRVERVYVHITLELSS